MIRLASLILLLATSAAVCLPRVLDAESAAVSVFSEANALYRTGDYEAARASYLKVVDMGMVDFRLFYNLGNACFKSQRIGKAIVWYERAQRLKPRDEDVRANLRFALHVKKDRQPADTDSAIWRGLSHLYMYPTENELSVALLLQSLVLLGLAVWRLRMDLNIGSTWRLLFRISCVMTVATAVYLGARAYQLEADTSAVITVEQAKARSGPDFEQTVNFVVHEGTTVHVEREEGEWSLIRLPGGLGGWVFSADLTEIGWKAYH